MNNTLSRVAACTAAGFATALIASTTMLGATAHAATGDTALYRLYSSRAGDHFYTTSAAERDYAVSHFGYANEGMTGYVGTQATSGRTPLYRVYSSQSGDHFYTTSAGERDNAVNRLGYRNEGIAGYVGTQATANSKTLYRLYSNLAGDHFYTTSAPERDNAIRVAGYNSEGVMGYVFNDGSQTAPVSTGQVQTPAPAPAPQPAPTPSDPTKFDKARVSLTFDDGWKSIHDNALPALTAHGMKSTQYLNSQPIVDNYADYMTYNDVKDFYTQGHELAWHTQTHADLTTLTDAQVDAELSLPANFTAGLNAVGVPVTLPNFANFATPYGAYNASTWSQTPGTAVSTQVTADPMYVINKIMAKFSSHRSTDVGFNTKGSFNANNIVVQNIEKTTTAANVQAWIDQAKASNAWLVLVYHEVYNTPDTAVPAKDRAYDVTTTELNAQLDAIKTSGISVETVAQALAEIRAQ